MIVFAHPELEQQLIIEIQILVQGKRKGAQSRNWRLSIYVHILPNPIGFLWTHNKILNCTHDLSLVLILPLKHWMEQVKILGEARCLDQSTLHGNLAISGRVLLGVG